MGELIRTFDPPIPKICQLFSHDKTYSHYHCLVDLCCCALDACPFPGQFLVLCGGSLLNRDTVLTAAHCLDHVPGARPVTQVRVGDHDITSTADGAQHEDLEIAEKILHPGWDPDTLENDLAVVKLARPVTYSRDVMPVCLPDRLVYREKNV